MNISLARSWLVVLVLLIAGPWAMVVWGIRHLPQHRAATTECVPSSAPNSSTGAAPVATTKPASATGPWGALEVTPITLMPPPEYIQESVRFSPVRSWHFAEIERSAFDDLLRVAGLTESQRSTLVATCAPGDPGGFVCTPDDAFVRAMSPDTRAHLYDRLGLDERNLDQDSAFRFAGPSIRAWLAEGGLRQELVDAIEPFAYRHGDYWMFADLRLVEPLAQDAEERTRLLRTLAADQALMVRLQVGADSHVDELAAYWGRGGRTQQVRPIIESLSRVPGGASLSIRALLPSFAQTRLSTYQSPTLDPVARQRDCHWTTMNFFNAEPDDAFLGNPQLLVEKLRSDYYPVFGNYQLGDVVLFMAGDTLFHSAVYVADDILFTKNGPNPSNPWMLARLKDVQDYYPQAEPIHIAYYRRKDID